MAQVQRVGARRVVLLVEDNADAQDVYSTTLRHAGFEVVQARSLEEANEAARHVRPDVVVLDCRLPDGDGLQLARGWRNHATMAKVPVIVLTAFSARQDMEAALLAGADAFLVKPCPGHMLALQIEKVLSGQRPSQRLRKPLL
jgi:DNA-binding response OmpR family regulator